MKPNDAENLKLSRLASTTISSVHLESESTTIVCRRFEGCSPGSPLNFPLQKLPRTRFPDFRRTFFATRFPLSENVVRVLKIPFPQVSEPEFDLFIFPTCPRDPMVSFQRRFHALRSGTHTQLPLDLPRGFSFLSGEILFDVSRDYGYPRSHFSARSPHTLFVSKFLSLRKFSTTARRDISHLKTKISDQRIEKQIFSSVKVVTENSLFNIFRFSAPSQIT